MEALDALREAGAAALKTVMALGGHGRRLAEAGFPSSWGAFGAAPFDLVGDFLRGRKGVMLDMFRCPEKLEAAAEKMLPMAVEMAVRGAAMSHNPRVFIAIHGGVEGFMSLDQYKRFYWPTLQQTAGRAGRGGAQPLRAGGGRLELAAGDHGRRPGRQGLLLVRPRGHAPGQGGPGRQSLHRRQRAHRPADRRHAGRRPRLLQRPHRQRGRDGGFIMGPSGQTEDVKIENVKAMVDFTKEYGG